MSTKMEENIKRWTTKRKAALIMEIIEGETTVAEASRIFDITPSEIEEGVDEAKRGMEIALRTKPLEIKEQYERQIKDLQEAYGEAMIEENPSFGYRTVAHLLDMNKKHGTAGIPMQGLAGTQAPGGFQTA